MWVDVGINGSSSDAQICNQSQLRAGIIDGTHRSLQLNYFLVMTVQCHTFLLEMMPFHFAHGSCNPSVAICDQMTRQYSTTDFHRHAGL